MPFVTAAIAPLIPPFDEAAAAAATGSSGTGSFNAMEIALVNAGKALFMMSVGLVFAIWLLESEDDPEKLGTELTECDDLRLQSLVHSLFVHQGVILGQIQQRVLLVECGKYPSRSRHSLRLCAEGQTYLSIPHDPFILTRVRSHQRVHARYLNNHFHLILDR
jgi:hypothetical protein